MAEEITMPVFKPMRKRRMLLGLGLREWMRVAGALTFGAMLALALGSWQHETDVSLTAAELQERYARYSVCQTALQKAESMLEATGVTDARSMDLTPDERASIALAKELGIEASMDRDELIALIPKSEARTVPVIADVPRWMICLGAPLVLTVLLNVEVSHNTTLSREAGRFIAFMRAQRVFISMPKAYLKGK